MSNTRSIYRMELKLNFGVCKRENPANYWRLLNLLDLKHGAIHGRLVEDILVHFESGIHHQNMSRWSEIFDEVTSENSYKPIRWCQLNTFIWILILIFFLFYFIIHTQAVSSGPHTNSQFTRFVSSLITFASHCQFEYIANGELVYCSLNHITTANSWLRPKWAAFRNTERRDSTIAAQEKKFRQFIDAISQQGITR